MDGVAIITQRKENQDLGIRLTSDLRWNSHLSQLILQSAGPIHLCKKLGYQHRLPFSVIRHFCVSSPKEYCNAFWCGLPRSQAIRLEKLQQKIAKANVRCRDRGHSCNGIRVGVRGRKGDRKIQGRQKMCHDRESNPGLRN